MITGLCVLAFQLFFITVRQSMIVQTSQKLVLKKMQLQLFEKKNRAGSDYFELTMRFNNIEFLVNSGFFGDNNGDKMAAFFGSSISNLPRKITERFDVPFTKDIFIPKTTRPYLTCERILNQYLKNHSPFCRGCS